MTYFSYPNCYLYAQHLDKTRLFRLRKVFSHFSHDISHIYGSVALTVCWFIYQRKYPHYTCNAFVENTGNGKRN